MNFDELKDIFLREVAARGRQRSTLRGERTRLQYFIDFCQTQSLTCLAEVKLEHVLGYQSSLSKFGPLTRYSKVGTACRWLNWAHHREHIFVNPVSDWGPKHPPQKLEWVPTQNQMQKALEIYPIESAKRFLMEFLYGTGLRVQECADLDVVDLDLEQHQLNVRKAKNGKPRVMPLGPNLSAMAAYYLEHLRPKNSCNALFLNEHGTRMNAYTISKWITRAGQACKFAKFTVHSIRRAFATHLIQNGAPLPAVKTLLGHDSYRTTQIYTRMVVQDLEDMISVAHPRAQRKSTKPPRS